MSEERDIVERLKERVVYDATHNPPADPLDAEAASEIQRLRGEVERLHQGLRVRGMRINSQAAVDDALAAIDEWKANADRWGGEVERLRIQYNSACETVVAQAFALKRQDALANLEREG